jgi:hypothetical protein
MAPLNGNKRWSWLNTFNGRGRVTESASGIIHKSGRISTNVRKSSGIRDRLQVDESLTEADEAEGLVVDWEKEPGGLNRGGPRLYWKPIFRRI